MLFSQFVHASVTPWQSNHAETRRLRAPRPEDKMTGMTKRFGLVVGAMVVALGLASVYVSAQNSSGGGSPFMGRGRGGPGGPGGPGRGGPMGMLGPLGPMIMGRLNLTDAQREQVKSVIEAHSTDMKAVGDRAFAAHQALEAVISADTVDESAIRARSADVATIDADMAVMRAQIRAEVWQILTPDQQQQARTLQAEMQQRMEQGRQQHQGKQKQSGAAK
jgi:periplasmic protein CpxP/Spy